MLDINIEDAPIRNVVGERKHPRNVDVCVDIMDCGHWLDRRYWKKNVKQKPCWKCLRELPKDWDEKQYKKLRGKMCYYRAGTVPIEDVLPYVFSSGGSLTHKRSYCNHRVKMTSGRLKIFKKSIRCVKCGIEGKYFAVEKHRKDKGYHLNLYALDKDGHEILMTKDHIIPVSKGGKNHILNYQTMCCICNEEKADKLEGEENESNN